MNDTRLKILDREEKGSSGVKRTRNEGFVPGVLYGKR
jgi:ribosomal protein L25 (general stress protein Ctc)